MKRVASAALGTWLLAIVAAVLLLLPASPAEAQTPTSGTITLSTTINTVYEKDHGQDTQYDITISATRTDSTNPEYFHLCPGGTATRGTDYTLQVRSIQHSPGHPGLDSSTGCSNGGTFTWGIRIGHLTANYVLRVTVKGDNNLERDESLTFRLVRANRPDINVETQRDTGLPSTPITAFNIRNDDRPHGPVMFLEMPAYYVNEGDSGHRDYPLKVHLSKPLPGNIDYRLHFQGNAGKGTDYEIYVGTGNTVFGNGATTQMAAGDQVQHYRIRVFGDTDDEGTEHLSIRMSKGGLRPETWGVPFLYSSNSYERSQGRAMFIRPHSSEADGKRDVPGPYFEKSNRRLFQFRDHGGNDFNVAWWGYATGPDHTIQLTEGGPSRSYGFRVSDDYTHDVTGDVLRMGPIFSRNTHDKLQCSWDNANWRSCSGLTRDLDRRDGVPADSPIVPPGLSAGDTFRLLFVTSTTRDATSTDIADYNSFVQGRAADGHSDIRPFSSLFKVLGSTTAVSAKTNTGTTGTGVPIYWVNGDKAADDYADFYDGNWDSSSARDEDGTVVTTNIDRIFTGTTNDGSSNLSAALGGGTLPNFASVGSLPGSIHSPLANAVDSNHSTHRFYGLSPVLTVGAGPSEATLHIRATNGKYLSDEEFTVSHRFASSKYGLGHTQATSGIIRVRVSDCASCPEPQRQDGPGRMTFHGSRNDAESGASPITSLTLKQGEVKQYWVRLLADYRGGTPGSQAVTSNTDLGRLQWLRVYLNSRVNGAVIADAAPGAGTQTSSVVYGSPQSEVTPESAKYAGPKPVYVMLRKDSKCHTNSDTVTHVVNGIGPAFTGATMTLNYVCPRVSFHTASGSKSEHDTVVQQFSDQSRQAPVIEYRLTRYDVRINLNPAPTEDLRLFFRYSGNAGWFQRTGTPVVDYYYTIDGRRYAAYKYMPWTGDYYIAYDGTDDRCHRSTHGPNDDQNNCARYSHGSKHGNTRYSGYLVTTIPANATQHTLKVFVWDDEVHDSGETVTLALQPWDNKAGGGGYTLGTQTTHTLTILNDEPAPQPTAPADPHAPDLDAPAPAQAGTEVLYTGEVLVGWPDYAGESQVHVRARSANGHGTKWGYNQEGNWHLFKGLQPGTWIIEVLKTDFATKLSGMLVTQVPEAKDLPAAPAPVVNVTPKGTLVTEGQAAEFTVSSSPPPKSPMTVSLTVSQGGDYAASGSTGTKKITIPTSGRITHAVATVNDATDEEYGSVTVTVNGGNGYTVGVAPTGSIQVADNDDPPPAAPVKPTVSVAAGSGIEEGGTASFTISASPAPASPLIVYFTVSGSGDYALADVVGDQAVIIQSGEDSASFSVPTVDDGVAELDGSFTVEVTEWEDYAVGSPSTVTVSVADDDRTTSPTLDPVVSISGGSGVTEGGAATFTLSASPAPTLPLIVSVTVSQSGDYTASGATGSKTVTIPTTGSATYSVATVGDTADEADGSVTVSVSGGNGYVVGTSYTATVAVSDDDATVLQPQPKQPESQGTAPDLGAPPPSQNTAKVLSNGDVLFGWPGARANPNYLLRAVSYDGHGYRDVRDYTKNWYAFDDLQAGKWVLMVYDMVARRRVGGWLTLQVPERPTVAQEPAAQDNTPQPTVSVSAGSGITEGGAASFTLSASPAPTSSLTVSLTVSQSGDYTAGGATGSKTVTIPTSGSATYSVATVDDGADEADGSITATLASGQGYTVGTPSSATVPVSDNDAAPTPAVSITGGSGVTEGSSAVFTLTATPAPTSPLTVSVTVSQSGAYAASGATGTKRLTIPTTGSYIYLVATVGDGADEDDGAITVTLASGGGYTVGTPSSATVSVSDDDDPSGVTCVTTDQALLSQVGAKLVRHVETGRADLLEMFTRSHDTMKGKDTYTVSDIKARPDKQGANWQGDGSNPLWQSVYAELDRLEACRDLAALLAAVLDGDDSLVSDLIDDGVDVDMQDDDGWTALHFAAWLGDADLVSDLIDAGADVSIQDDDGWTALRVAQDDPKSGVSSAQVVALLQGQ